jgi:tyrosyl-tRNA synthetase
VELAKKYDCRVQIGGSDQWGNIVEGMELHRKMTPPDKREATKLFGLTTPLITTSSGAKMGKTADGAVWLDEDKVSAYDYYQFWRNSDDADVIRFLKFFTELPIEQINDMKKWEGSAQINDAKKILAFEATKLCHGEAAAQKAQATAITAFEQGGTAGLPEITIENKTYKAFELFVAAGLAASNGESRRLIQGGGAKVDDVKVESDSEEIKPKDGMKISSGKKKHVIIKLK